MDSEPKWKLRVCARFRAKVEFPQIEFATFSSIKASFLLPGGHSARNMSSVTVLHKAGLPLLTLLVRATAGLQGQVLKMPIEVYYPDKKPPIVEIEIQKRHNKARFNMDLFSENEYAIPIVVQTTLSNGKEVEHFFSVGAKTLGWSVVTGLGRDYNCDSVWKIWSMDKDAENKCEVLFSISFKKIKLDKGTRAAEIFYYSDGEETDDEWEEFVKPKEKVIGKGENEIQTRKQVVEGIIASHKEKNAVDQKEPNETEEKILVPEIESESEGEGSDVCYSPKPKKSRRD